MSKYQYMSEREAYVLDDRHEVFNIYKSLCASCRHYNGEYACAAFPDGIPERFLTGEESHKAIIETRVGEFTYQAK